MPPRVRIGAGIDREEQARVAQMIVELLARDAGLDHAVEVGLVHGEDAVHARQIERDAAERRVDVAFERGAGAERDHRHAGLGAELHDVGDLGFGLGEQDGVGRLALEPGERVGVLLAQRLAQREAVAEARGQVGRTARALLSAVRGCRPSAMTAVMAPSYRVLRRESLGFSAEPSAQADDRK